MRACYHRHVTHSLFVPLVLLLAGAASVLYSRGGLFQVLAGVFLAGTAVGMFSHDLADAFLSKVWLLWPLYKGSFTLLGLPKERQGGIEKVTFFLATMADLYVLGVTAYKVLAFT